MAVASVMYPGGPEVRFDEDYYFSKHVPLAQNRWGAGGPTQASFLRGVSAPDGGPPAFRMVALLTFASTEAAREAFAGRHAPELFGDIPNFTDSRPTVQISEEVA